MKHVNTPSGWAIVGVGLLVSAILIATYFEQGFVAAGRSATYLVMPVSIVWLALLAVSIGNVRSGRRGKALFFLILFSTWSLVGNGHFVKTMMARIEVALVDDPHPAFEQRYRVDPQTGPGEPLDAIVTLGGSAHLVMPGFPEMGGDGERLVSAAQAYHAGAVRTIITTGTSTDGIGNPNEVGRDLLVSLGVPEHQIFLIEGQNTSQEMESLAAFLKEPPERWSELVGTENIAQPIVGLLTSAFHLRRAMRLAKSAELDLVPLPCAFRTQRLPRPWVASDVVPTAENLNGLGLVIKETMASVLGR